MIQTAFLNNGPLTDCLAWFIFAIKAIKSGDELTFDYNWELKAVSEDMFKKSATKCKCRKPKCRTYIERMKMQGMRQREQGLCECESL